MTSQFTDFLNNPVNEGDVIVYPISIGSSNAIAKATVCDVFPFIFDQVEADRSKREWDDRMTAIGRPRTAPYAEHSFNTVLERDIDKANPTRRRYPVERLDARVFDPTVEEGTTVERFDHSKAYVVRVLKDEDSGYRRYRPKGWKPKKQTIQNVDKIVVVSSLVPPGL